MSTDEDIGANVARLRGEMGLRQLDLAQRMGKRGWAWTQPIVVQVERGRRPVKAAELVDLGAILGASAAMLLGRATTADYGRLQIESAARAQLRHRIELREMLAAHERARRALIETLDRYASSELDPHDKPVVEDTALETLRDVVEQVEFELEPTLGQRPSGNVGAHMTAYLAGWEQVRIEWARQDERLPGGSPERKDDQ